MRVPARGRSPILFAFMLKKSNVSNAKPSSWPAALVHAGNRASGLHVHHRQHSQRPATQPTSKMNSCPRRQHSQRPAMPQLKQKWRPPDTGWLKVNSDGAVAKVRNSGGAGAVIRDHDGAFRAGLCHFFRGVAGPESVEILACK